MIPSVTPHSPQVTSQAEEGPHNQFIKPATAYMHPHRDFNQFPDTEDGNLMPNLPVPLGYGKEIRSSSQTTVGQDWE